jgi:hypothetical protein
MDPRTWREANLPALQAVAAQAGEGSDARPRLTSLIDRVEAAIEADRVQTQTGEPDKPQPRVANRRQIVGANLRGATVNLFQAWHDLSRNLNLDESTGWWTLDYDLSQTPGWDESSPDVRSQIVSVARRFLSAVPADHPQYRRDNLFETDGFMAALLLADEAPAELDALSSAEWTFWLPGFVTTGAGMADANRGQRLARLAYAQYPDAMRRELRALFRMDDAPMVVDRVLQGLDPCWDEALGGELVGVLGDEGVPLTVRRAVLAALLRRGERRVDDIALAWVGSATADRSRAVAAGWTLLIEGRSETIARLIPIMAADRALAKEMLLAAAPLARRFPSSRGWPVSLLMDVYVLAVDLFPPTEDPELRPESFQEIGECGEVAYWRDGLLTRLASQGNWGAVEALENLAQQRPDLLRPRELWHEAHREALARTWEPLSDPLAALEVVADAQRRVIRNADQLLDLVRESLARLQDELADGGVAADLWSEWPVDRQKRYRPKPEVSFSDYVKRFLDRDLHHYTIAANREVENRPGNETDLLVTYVDRDDRGRDVRRLSVVIEAKGCWHPEVLTAIEEQLADRYLVDYEADRGLYLVGWYRCDHWDPGDDDRGKPAGHTLESLRDELASQARRLSNEHRRIEAVVLDAALRLTPRTRRPRRSG